MSDEPGGPEARPSGAACWKCVRSIDAPDHYCRWCGSGQGAHLPWFYEPFWIGVLTLFALGPFSLGLIWRTPRLGARGRWLWTGAVLGFTFYLVKSTYLMYQQVKAYMSLPV